MSDFAGDVRRGLSSTPKFLSSKYFYDDEGSRLFQQIMDLPEYYLTRTELGIFEAQTDAICEAFSAGAESFEIIELGAGDGSKTSVLIRHFLAQNRNFSYSPVDISGSAVDGLTARFRRDFPALVITPQTGDYFTILGNLRSASSRRKIILFLGSNIGNYSDSLARQFFAQLRGAMNADDLLFVGFDLHKDPRVILGAYDDPAGITAAFNLNLLKRINRELGGDFDLAQFSHYATYHPTDRAARSFLISRAAQRVHLTALGQSFDFTPWEPIFTEISQKYDLATISQLAHDSGFAVIRNFTDAGSGYANSLWRPKFV